MKRKADSEAGIKAAIKRTKKVLSKEEAQKRFRKGLFDQKVLDQYTKEYAASSPYKHAVIHELVDDGLLRSVRQEIRENVLFTPKETDIYKIHQSGDLANLDGLPDEALSKLPSLLRLRDALYSETFRNYVSHITGCGPLSARKTDLAVNVYTPGCYLLCHDDVIGSRKVSYILYLTDPDPDHVWQSSWGGALRLFPILEQTGAEGEVAKTIGPDPVKVIPPAFNQLSFFAVQPGESFHDVEEVYHAESAEALARDGGRVRMAVSGWFHIPQPGEEGFVQGAEEAQAKNSGLMQLQGNPDQHDLPQSKFVSIFEGRDYFKGGSGNGSGNGSGSQDSRTSQEFNEEDLAFLLKYLSPSYLTPDTMTGIFEYFQENSSITLPSILNDKFADRLRKDIVQREKTTRESDKDWHVAKPPHKHRFLYMQPTDAPKDSAWDELLNVLLPSMPFRTWLEMATNTTVESYDLLARRFRRGMDYTLATNHEGKVQLELNLGLTPTEGWGDEEEEVEEGEEGEEEEGEGEGEEETEKKEEEPEGKGKGKAVDEPKEGKAQNGSSKAAKEEAAEDEEEQVEDDGLEDEADLEKPNENDDCGGHEVYLAGDDGEDDAAVYKTAKSSNEADADADDNILFYQAAAWNKMTLVLRDSNTLRFVKYVNRRAAGDRWDVSATFALDDGDPNAQIVDSEPEEEFKGFSNDEDSDSD